MSLWIVSVPNPEARIIPINDAKTLMRNSSHKAKLPTFNHHDMRHYFCSNAIETGIDFKVIVGWLGHKDGGILVAKTYGHLRDAHSSEMTKRMTFSVAEQIPDNVTETHHTRTGCPHLPDQLFL